MTTPNDIHALVGAYAVDALDDLERVAFERHLAGCDECQDEVTSLREAAGLLAETTTAQPPAALRDRVLADITKAPPTMKELMPCRMESWPRDGPTVRSSTISTGAGSAPARRMIARSRASLISKLPVIEALPPPIRSWITGAE